MKTEGTNLHLLIISDFWSSSRWPLDELQKAEKYPIRWSLQTGFTEVFALLPWFAAEGP